MKERKIPAITHGTLKFYGRTRSKRLVNHFFSSRLYLSYDRELEITEELSDTNKTLLEH